MKKTPTLAERIRLTVVLVTLAVFIATALGAMYYRFKNGRSVYYDFKVCQFEKMNDEEKYPYKATQEDIYAFFGRG